MAGRVVGGQKKQIYRRGISALYFVLKISP
jgi:hypothetical protein